MPKMCEASITEDANKKLFEIFKTEQTKQTKQIKTDNFTKTF